MRCVDRMVTGCARLLPLLLLVLVSGCGAAAYEQRLQETAKYFAYVEKLDANLAAPFKAGSIDELRVPLQFREIKAPPLIKNEKGEVVPPDVDPRQPNYLLMEFPKDTLIATWEAPFDVVTKDGVEKRKGYIYALSNASMSDPDQAADFTKNVLNKLAEALRVPTPDYSKFDAEEYPRAKMYTVPNKFRVYRFGADQAVIDGLPYTVELYLNEPGGDVQLLLVVVLPVGIDSKEKLAERIPMMLESLKANKKKQPIKKSGPAAATGGVAPEAPKPNTGF